MGGVSIQLIPSSAARRIAAIDSSSSWSPQACHQPAPPIAHAPYPTRLIRMPVLPSSTVPTPVRSTDVNANPADGVRAGRAARHYDGWGMRVLLTNDDGIEAEGLQTLRRALLEIPAIELAVVAPDGNRSAFARMITTRRPLWVQEVAFDDGTTGYATDGTPVDCVRLAKLGLIDGFEPEIVVAGINYSGTVAAALEAIVLGIPGIAVSQQSLAREMDFRLGSRFSFDVAAEFTARVIDELDEVPLAAGTLLNVNVPTGEPEGVEVTKLGKRIYRDELKLAAE